MREKKNALAFSLLILVMFWTAAGCANMPGLGAEDEDLMNHAVRQAGNSSSRQTIHFLSSVKDNAKFGKVISDASKEYEKEHKNVELEYESVSLTDLVPRVQLLAASNDLPTLFTFESGKPLQDLIQGNLILNLDDTFTKLGLYDKLNPIAVNLLKRLSGGGGLYTLPLEINVEGFWYNKTIFQDNHLQVPATWKDMLQTADLLKQRGIQPFAVAGKEKWPITRFISAYAMREYGVDAMDRVGKGQLKLTDPGFVKAAETVQMMGKKGYFGQKANTIDEDTALDMFLQGKAAMYYTGSWDLFNFNNPQRNKIGADHIGFFNIPLVEGGKGTLDDYAMNCGITVSFSKAGYNPAVADWIRYVFGHFGDRAINDYGMITGFRVDHYPLSLPPLTKLVLEKINNARGAGLWWESAMGAQTTRYAQDNAQLLIMNTSMTPLTYLQVLQQAIDQGNH